MHGIPRLAPLDQGCNWAGQLAMLHIYFAPQQCGTVCSAVLAGGVGSTTLNALTGGSLTKYTITDQQKAVYMDRAFGTSLSGEQGLIHNSALCKATMDGVDTTFSTGGTLNDTNLAAEATAAHIIAAITPLNQLTYQFIYPEETDVDFKDTMDLVQEVGFTNSFSYIFSPRPGTVASNLRQIDKDKAKERLKIIQDKLFYFQNDKNKKYINKTIDVLVENKTKLNNQYFGRAEDITPVFIDCNKNITGETIKVNITKTNKVNLFGSMVL